jgi:hypothetical protein
MTRAERRHYWVEVLAGPAATLLGILVAGFSVVYTVNANNETEHTRQAAAAVAQKEQQQVSFELAAAQIVMSQRSCALASARARELVQLFPTRLQSREFKRLTRPTKKLCRALRRTNPTGGGGGLGFLPFLPF